MTPLAPIGSSTVPFVYVSGDTSSLIPVPAGVDMREWIRLVRSSNSIIHKSKEHATVATVYAAAVLTDINSIQQLPIPSGASLLLAY